MTTCDMISSNAAEASDVTVLVGATTLQCASPPAGTAYILFTHCVYVR